MATISNTPRPGYVWDATDNVWYPIGVGGHGHTDYITQATAISPTTVDAKGDLLVGSAADTISRLAVGADGSSIVADSSTATGLSYQANWAAGKNKIINGNFGIWQRGTSFSTTSSLAYTADRWWTNAFSGTATVSQQTFTAGTAPVAGYEGQYFLRFACTSTFTQLGQRIEDVRTYAGQTVTISFWAKAASALSLTPYLEQNFGSGGSASVYTSGTAASVTTSWQRFTATVSVASISGKTIGTSSFLNFYFLTSTLSTNIDIWGVQVEAGSVATAFQTATGTLQGELAACQRYCVKFGDTSQGYGVFGSGIAYASTNVDCWINLPVEMRSKPSSITYSGCRVMDWVTFISVTSMTIDTPYTNTKMLVVNCAVTGATTLRPYSIGQNNNTGDYIIVSAEL